MTDGLGSGFFALTLLVLLGVGAVLLGLTAAGALALDRRRGRVPVAVRFLAMVLLAAVVVVAGFGVLVLADEAVVAAALVVAIAFAPVVAVVVRQRRAGRQPWLAVLATAGLAWGPSYLLGVVVAFGLDIALRELLDLAPAEPLSMAVAWVAAAGGGVVAAGVAAVVGARLASVLRTDMPVRTGESG